MSTLPGWWRATFMSSGGTMVCLSGLACYMELWLWYLKLACSFAALCVTDVLWLCPSVCLGTSIYAWAFLIVA